MASITSMKRRATMALYGLCLMCAGAIGQPAGPVTGPSATQPIVPSFGAPNVPQGDRPIAPPITRPNIEFVPRLVIATPVDIPVRLDAVSVDAEIQGSQAVTRIELTFFNPNRRVLEGELQFPLLAGQDVIGLALDIDGKLREAVPVDKAKGQQVFEDVIRQRIDPALLEKTVGNNYKLRLYPLPANGSRRVVLRVLESLPVRDGNLIFRLPLAYAGTLPALDLRLRVLATGSAPVAIGGGVGEMAFARRGELYEAQVSRQNFTGQGVLELRVPAPARPVVSSQTVAGQTYFRAEIPAPAGVAVPRRVPGRVALYWDASGSGAQRDHPREFALLGQYIAALGNGTGTGEVTLVRFRDVPEAPQAFAITRGNWQALRQALEKTAYDGATRFGGLPRVAGAAEALLVTDGLATYGREPFPALGIPVYPVVAAAAADASALQWIARHSGGKLVDLTRLAAGEAADALLRQTTAIAELGGEGVSALVSAAADAQEGRYLIAGEVVPGGGSLRVVLRDPGGKADRVIDVPVPPARADGSLAALTWGLLKMAELDGEYDLRRAEIRRLGQKFRLPSRETSLIVLDRAEDYARYDIEPPPELSADVERLRATGAANLARTRTQHLERVVGQFRERAAWWEKEFPKNAPPPPPPPPIGGGPRAAIGGAIGALAGRQAETAGIAQSAQSAVRQESAARDRPAPAPAPLAPMPAAPAAAMAKAARGEGQAAPAVGIAIKKATPDAPYIRRFRDAQPDALYTIYMDERASWANSSAFFLDAADEFLQRKQTALALRVLSNLAEMNLENRALLRILGYRLLQAGQPALAIPAFEKVRDLAPNEPQSFRDLGLAYAAGGQVQKAVDALWDVVARAWDARFPDIEMTALAELNAIVAGARDKPDVSRIDPRLLRNLPLDLRVVLTWDTDNSDMDLWVTDPNGEKAFYGNRLSYQGGRVSADFTGGYGPEEFALRHAKPGRYLIQAQFYGHRQQVLAGATTLQVRLQTGFGTPAQKEEAITLRLGDRSEVVTVGEFTVEAPKAGR